MENELEKGEKKKKKKRGKVDTKRLEHFADVDNFRLTDGVKSMHSMSIAHYQWDVMMDRLKTSTR